jgi:peptidoglycan/xylan/chitin deacetylase (PgdA/CDA1 family)
MAFAGLGTLLPPAVVRRRLPIGNGILLTFDDGPDPIVTPAVLDRLRAANARAVFFVVGRRAEAYPALLRQIRDDGHLIGNHSYSHLRPQPFRPAAYRRDLVRCQNVVSEIVNERPRLFRPPYGLLTALSLVAPRTLGLKPVTWSVDVQDWSCRDAESADRAGQGLLDRAAERDIVLLHDNHGGVLTVLDRALPGLRERGYDLASGVEALSRRAG